MSLSYFLSVDFLIQLGLASLSLAPIALAQSKSPSIRKYDCIAGLIAQPFWFAYGWSIGGLALMFLSFIYMFVFAYGFKAKWMSKKDEVV